MLAGWPCKSPNGSMRWFHILVSTAGVWTMLVYVSAWHPTGGQQLLVSSSTTKLFRHCRVRRAESPETWGPFHTPPAGGLWNPLFKHTWGRCTVPPDLRGELHLHLFTQGSCLDPAWGLACSFTDSHCHQFSSWGNYFRINLKCPVAFTEFWQVRSWVCLFFFSLFWCWGLGVGEELKMICLKWWHLLDHIDIFMVSKACLLK